MFAMISNWLFQDSIHFMGRKCENYFMKIFLLAIELLCHQLVVKYSRLCNFYFNFMNELLTTPGTRRTTRSPTAGGNLDTSWMLGKNLMKIFSAWKVPHFEAQSCKICLRGGGKYKYTYCYVANFYLDNLWLCIFRYLLICQFVYLWIYFVCG